MSKFSSPLSNELQPIYSLISFVLLFVFVGVLCYIALFIIGIVFPIIGGIKANHGELWKYPLVISIIK